ncbi:hypothetical protein ABK040_003487 [Willaertia magna]
MNFHPKPTPTFPNYLFDKFQSLSVWFNMDDFAILKKFTNLKTIHTWKIPNNYIFDNLLKLEEIYIYDSELNNKSLSKLTQLRKLSLQDSKFNADLIDDEIISLNINQLKHLQILTVATVRDSDYLKELINLKKLIISPFKKTFLDSSNLKNLTNLEYLDFNGRINDEDFKNLTKLKYLKIQGSFSGKLIDYLPSLEELYCNFKKIKNNNSYLKNVKRLSLQCCELTDLKQFTNLVKLDISFTCDSDHFNGECFLHLINLEKLNMKRSDTKKIKDEHFINLKKLEHLNISYCKGITGECFKYLTQLKILFAEKSEVKEEYLEHLQNIFNSLLNELEVGEDILIFRVEIEKTKKRIEKGELLKEIIKEKKEIEEENTDDEDYEDDE